MAQWQREIARQYVRDRLTRRMAERQVPDIIKPLKKLTLLHSNDLHGDFLADELDSHLVGGASMLSGYVQKVRHDEDNVLYAIAGDMFRGSVIDSEYQGLSTIQIMNMLSPDAVTVGNHEVDYGIAHLLFLEKCANFPIISANLRIAVNNTRLFEPFRIITVGGIRVLFIGVVTEAVLSQCKDDGLVGSLITVEDAVKEIGRICNTYGGIGVDLTVLLTHIGFEADKKLAAQLNPAWGVDVIIGGHSHTLLDEPEVVNGIPIVQVGVGTDYIGRFDLVVDTLRNCIASFEWQAIPIDAEHCPTDKDMEDLIFDLKKTTDRKYDHVITRLDRKLEHPLRMCETEIGDLLCDVLCDALGVDVFLLGSGSIRGTELGPMVTRGTLNTCFPYDGSIHTVHMTGAQLRHALLHMLRDETLAGGHAEFFQVSHGLEVEYDQATHSMLRFNFEGAPVNDDQVFSVGIQHYFFNNLDYAFDLTLEELRENRPPREVSTSCFDILEEVLATGDYRDVSDKGRIKIHPA